MFYVISGFLIRLILSGKYSADLHGRWVFYSTFLISISIAIDRYLVRPVDVWRQRRALAGKFKFAKFADSPDSGQPQVVLQQGRDAGMRHAPGYRPGRTFGHRNDGAG
jgi:hypothetical protein